MPNPKGCIGTGQGDDECVVVGGGEATVACAGTGSGTLISAALVGGYGVGVTIILVSLVVGGGVGGTLISLEGGMIVGASWLVVAGIGWRAGNVAG